MKYVCSVNILRNKFMAQSIYSTKIHGRRFRKFLRGEWIARVRKVSFHTSRKNSFALI